MQKVKEIMTREVVTVGPETEIGAAAALMLENHVNGLPVVDADGRLLGVITQSDLITQQKRFPLPSVFTLVGGVIPLRSQERMEQELAKMSAATVGEAMTKKPRTVGPEDSVEAVATLMVEKKFHTVPVVENNRLVGVVGKEDVLRTVLA
ncbi:MAG: CBS domain-containing protein [Proteobacteria bacterium]|nr:CBS domain-containing protein [Pseudomonadota bacterium]